MFRYANNKLTPTIVITEKSVDTVETSIDYSPIMFKFDYNSTKFANIKIKEYISFYI